MSSFIVTCKLGELNATALNNTRKAGIEIIFFNRVPKVGSETLAKLMALLSKKNGFHARRSNYKGAMQMFWPKEKQKSEAYKLIAAGRFSTFTQHVYYINFGDFELPQPIYINLIRDPVERVISWFYFIRASWYVAQKYYDHPNKKLPRVRFLKRQFDECVLTHNKECNYQQNNTVVHRELIRQMSFFCGQSVAECYPFDSPRALQLAKRNVERSYAVVGSWEDTNVTLTVLEHYIPRFFKGALEEYFLSEIQLHSHENPMKPVISEEVKNIVRQNLTNELEFYNFCKQRLYKQYLAIKLVS